jgi:hypothetical protein
MLSRWHKMGDVVKECPRYQRFGLVGAMAGRDQLFP